jgi:hypothetical protein
MVIETSVWIYWCFCLIAAALVISNRESISALLSPDSCSRRPNKGRLISIALAWIASMLTVAAYILFTQKLADGSYRLTDVVVFALLNGILEQFMFVFWFLLGCWLMRKVTRRPLLVFLGGYFAFVAYSGPIHILFWFKILPQNVPAAAPMAVLFTTMSLLWMWVFWRYRGLASVISMHIVIDFLMTSHLHSDFFAAVAMR